jgi:hypothetical protein
MSEAVVLMAPQFRPARLSCMPVPSMSAWMVAAPPTAA